MKIEFFVKFFDKIIFLQKYWKTAIIKEIIFKWTLCHQIHEEIQQMKMLKVMKM